MSATDLLLLLGVFLGGAAPWLEAIIVIPAGILAGLNPAVTVVAGTVGNLLTVAVAAWFGERIRAWWRRRRARKRVLVGDGNDTEGETRSASWQRAQRIAQRWGMPALAALGPIGLGTQVSAIVGVSLGLSARASFVWIGIATVLWAIVAAWATLAGVSIAGVSA